MAGAAGLGIAGRIDRPDVRAQRQRLGRHRRVDFVKSQSMDFVGRRDPTGLRPGGGRYGADDPERATERRTAADLGAIPFRRRCHLRFSFIPVGSDVAADPVQRAIADPAAKHPLYLLRPVSGGDGEYAPYVENAKTDALERVAAQDWMTYGHRVTAGADEKEGGGLL